MAQIKEAEYITIMISIRKVGYPHWWAPSHPHNGAGKDYE